MCLILISQLPLKNRDDLLLCVLRFYSSNGKLSYNLGEGRVMTTATAHFSLTANSISNCATSGIFFPRFVIFHKLKAFQRSIFSVRERKQAGFLTEIRIWDTHCGG